MEFESLSLFFIISAILLVVVFVVYILFSSIVFVPQSMKYTLERFGRYTKTLEAGIHFIVPIIYQISNKVSIKEKVLDIPPQSVITKDNAMITVDGVVFHKVFDPEKATYQIDDLDEAIKQLTLTNIRNVMGSMVLDNILSDRDKINDSLLHVVDKATDPWGIKISRIEIKDIKPPQNLIDAMAQQMIAERNKRAQILEAEGSKQSEILKAEGYKESLILGAQAEKTAQVLQAEGAKQSAILNAESDIQIARYDADSRKLLAAAEAEATKLLSRELVKGDVQAINYFLGLKYVEALKTIGQADNQKLVLMPYEATQILGSIAGMGDIFKEVMQNKEIPQTENEIKTVSKPTPAESE